MISFKKTRLASLACIAAAGALVLAGCGGGTAKPADTGASEAPASGATGTLNLGVMYETTNYHPSNTSSALAMGTNWHIVEGLYEFDMADYKVYPALAKGEPNKVSDTEYEVSLRDGAKFSDGTEVKAEDVISSFERIVKGETGADGKPVESIYKQFFDFIDSMTAKDDTTVSIKLKYPFGALQQRLVDIKIVPKAASFDDLTSKPIGTGPFKYTNITPTSVEAEPNPNYNGPYPAKVSKMHWDVLKDDNARLTAAMANTIDVMESVPAPFVKQLTGAGWKVDEVPGYNNPFLMFNTTKAPFDKAEVRQAFHYAIDKQTLINTTLEGKAKVSTSFLPESNPDYKKAATQFDYNPEKAKEMLQKAGVAGKTVNLLTTDHPWIAQLAPLVKQNLEAAGLKVNVTSKASADVYATTDSENPDFDVVMAPGDPSVFGTDPGIIVNWWYGDNVWTQKRTGFQKSDAEGYKKIAEGIQAAQQLSGDEAKAKWGEVQDLIAEKVPLYPLFHRTMLTGYNPNKVVDFKAIGTTGLEAVGVSVK
ncbi:peptide/nickel transport system substrate-binding protein [Mobiluncus mulieris]|uniref:Glutathione-binding protein gsiB n=1 Tax=Mobiluncus mulieris TaxID=2052 RepID=A0A8G2HY27_9ACTO|nr:ABC transporter substrate-binding protein [Mobiluncus mulieris]EEJ53932.1 ABC transporter, substrate-binding protein, family 5 [Mobiluncus mulieris ATCC 35243]EFN93882.1 ABC transporter, substrate-binding protein, family 5 [Mobiluncus mulieris FB024-16]MBB5845864.1 peptide/nickel transport system substrate-binding protein [Mobiluncus mulieris]MCV0003446.1 ABC transporter substrate-binding protein [Mobiluncus mulieris]MCV0012590.1 ABC transporter substrate-binding protein [Mobiluncus mulieri